VSFVSELVAGERERTGAFCNYACLATHIEDAGLTDGACCEWEP
jgi:hypothetical protein